MDSGLFQNVLESIFSAAFLASMLRVTTPILLPSLGALISDRAGVINIGLEGIMLIAAFTGVVFSAYAITWWGETNLPPWFGLLMGVVAGAVAALLLGFFHLRLKANLILSGIAINFLGEAGTIAVMFELTGDKNSTSATLDNPVMPFVHLPHFLADVPVLSFFYKIFDNQSIMTWIAFASVMLVWYLMYRTPLGMHLRAVGENPDAAASVGIRVNRTRYVALALSGILAALGGIHMSMGYLTAFQARMTSGRGFIALATPYLGGGHPVGTGLASVIFGFFEAITNRVGSLAVPPMLPKMLPYVATILALVIYAMQNQLTVRVRALRSAEGDDFDARYWSAIQRLSVLHMLLAMLATFGLIVTASMAAAPKGFLGLGTSWTNTDVFTYAALVGTLSLTLVIINVPFMLHVERIGRAPQWSAAASMLSLWLYLGLLFMLFLKTTAIDTYAPSGGFALGLGLSMAIWWLLGGGYLLQQRARTETATA